MIKVPALSCQKEALSRGPITRAIDLSEKANELLSDS